MARTDAFPFGPLFVAFVLVLAAIFTVDYSTRSLECSTKGIWMGQPYKFDWPGVCLIEVGDSKWFPVENVLYVMPEVAP
jgi:hypothetical protein